MLNVEPVTAPFVAKVGFALRDLVGVVREDIVYAATVNIKVFTEVFHGDAGAFDVPAGITDAPRAVPFERLILELGLGKPEHEIALVALVGVFFDIIAHTDHQTVFIMSGQRVIVFDLRRIKVDVGTGFVGVALLDQDFDDPDELIDDRGRGNDDLRLFDVELSAVLEERIGVKLRDLHDGFMLTLRALEHLILAGIRVTCQMADVRDVHGAAHIVAYVAQELFKHVLADIAAQVADMSKVVDGRAAGIHIDAVAVDRHELIDRFGLRVI